MNYTIAVHVVRYNHPLAELQACIRAVLSQDYHGFTITLTENGSRDSIRSEIVRDFGNDPRFRYLENETNLGFAGAHNRFIAQCDADLIVPLNPDTAMEPFYLRSLAAVFADPQVAAATGKMLKPDSPGVGMPILDGTGIVMSRARRGRERGQLLADKCQFDDSRRVFGVSGTASAYRKTALERVRTAENEYFDEDFFAYWEDLDLSWRLRLAGYECAYVPEATIRHVRVAGQTNGGYGRVLQFVEHRRKLPVDVLRWNWRNQLFCVIKNDFGWSFWRDLPFIAARQIGMFGYMVVFEPQTLSAVFEFCPLLPKMLKKRKAIMKMRTVSSREIGQWFREA